MKKIVLIAFFAISGTVFGASVTWTMTNLEGVGDGFATTSNYGNFSAYLVDASVSGEQLTTLLSGSAETIKANDKVYAWGSFGVASKGPNGVYLTNDSIGNSLPDSGTYDYYVVVIGTVDNVTKYITTTPLTDRTMNSMNQYDAKWGNISDDGYAWTTLGGGSTGGDVPEPTSGLLLLVGGALLALRRKQK